MAPQILTHCHAPVRIDGIEATGLADENRLVVDRMPRMGVRKQRILITDDGRDVMRSEHLLYRRLFEDQDHVVLTGAVKAGLGEGRYYLSRPGYVSQFESKLGWAPYPGTLNLELTGAEAN